MEKETNEQIDKFFSQFGQIIRKTWFSTYKGNRQPNGNRSLVMQVNEGMGIERKLMYTGITSGRKGTIRVFIKDNPTYVEDVTPYMKASAQNEKKN